MMSSPSLRSQLAVAWVPVASHAWVDAPKDRRVRMRSGMRVVAVVRRAGLGQVYPPLRVGDELLAAGRVVADGSEGVERQRVFPEQGGGANVE